MLLLDTPTGEDRTSVLLDGEWSITVTVPDNAHNFLDCYHDHEALDSDFLMAPINEADYDSETQFCVDSKTDGPKSFYDHYVTKRKKKKKKKSKDDAEPPSPAEGPMVKPKTVPTRPPARDFLAVPYGPVLGNVRGALNTAAARRLACGRMPTWSEDVPLPSDLPDEASPGALAD